MGGQPVFQSTAYEGLHHGLDKLLCYRIVLGQLLSIPRPRHVRAPWTQIIFQSFQSRIFDLHNSWTDLSSAQVYTAATATTESTILSKSGPRNMLRITTRTLKDTPTRRRLPSPSTSTRMVAPPDDGHPKSRCLRRPSLIENVRV